MTRVVSPATCALIEGFESGNQAEYEASEAKPNWPGDDSGVTIGIGYDLGYASADQVEADWRYLDPHTVHRLAGVCGVTGSDASELAHALSDIVIPYATAKAVFETVDMPRTAALVEATFAHTDELSDQSFGALVSLVFNRGADCSNTPERREMFAIKNLMAARQFGKVPHEIWSMQRLWPTLAGLRTRREVEARTFREGLPANEQVLEITVPKDCILVENDKGPLVKALQAALKAKAVYVDYKIDGIFGHETKTAVAIFQARSGLSVDGVVGPLTWAALGVPTA